jgi:hypothetical protein
VVDAARVQGGAISLAAKAMNQDHHSSRKKTPHSVFQALGMAQEPTRNSVLRITLIYVNLFRKTRQKRPI